MGPIGSISPSGEGRLKGFLDIQISDRPSADIALDIMEYGMGCMRDPSRAHKTQTDLFENRTRLSVRFVATNEMVPYLEYSLPNGLNIEAVMPVWFAGESSSVVYFGHNDKTRQPSEARTKRNTEVIRDVFLPERQLKEVTTAIRQVRSNGYEIDAFTGDRMHSFCAKTGTSINAISHLMEVTFGYGSRSARNVLTNPGNIISVARKGGLVVGMCAVEMSGLAIDGHSLKIAELTDVVVASGQHGESYSNYNGSNLSFAITSHALTMPELHSFNVFGEYTLRHPAAPRSAMAQGHKLAGMLPEHAMIENEPATLAVLYIEREDLAKLRQSILGVIR